MSHARNHIRFCWVQCLGEEVHSRIFHLGGLLEETALDHTLLFLSKGSATSFSRPQLAAHPLPAVSCDMGQMVVLASTCAGAWGSAIRAGGMVVVRLVEVDHGIVGHWRSARWRQGITQSAGATAARVISQGVAATSVSRSHTSGWRGPG